ncbi:MAG: RDD family protein [Terriglobales bacterium]
MANTGLFCSQCGELNDANAQTCRKCGASQPASPNAASRAPAFGTSPAAAAAPQPAAYAPPSYSTPGAAFATPAPTFAASEYHGYGGFWIRVLATIIDGLVLGMVLAPLFVIIFVTSGAAGGAAAGDPQAATMAIMSLMPMFMLLPVAVGWLYEALMVSSSKQATLGHLVLHMKVVDKSGERLSFMHATGRYFAKLINNLTFYIGWLLVAFTERKQGLHDMIAGTYMIKTQ